nr:CatB-related O-acetyltransferase [uncultured Acetatifactor sp.]
MKKLILFGAGELGIKWLKKIGKDKVYAFADFNIQKIGKEVEGKRVISIESVYKLDEEKAIFISTSKKYRDEIRGSLVQYGLGEYLVGTPFLELGHDIDLDTYIDAQSVLEGRNSISSGTNVIESYIGYASYIAGDSQIIKTRIGRYCSIGPNVKIIRGQHPVKEFVSTYPGFYSPQNSAATVSFCTHNLFDEFKYSNYPYAVSIGNDVWIGADVRIMEGVKIADGTIIGAGGVVVKDTEPYMILGGVPARLIGERFSKRQIEFLLELKWWNKSEDWIRNHAAYFKNIHELEKVIGNEYFTEENGL